MGITAGKICSACKRKNEPNAKFCIYCGTTMEHTLVSPAATEPIESCEMPESHVPPLISLETIQRALKPPREGIAIYVENFAVPAEVQKEQEFVLGRKISEEQGEVVTDLAPFGAMENGVSRRHAMIRRANGGYEVIDLESTNGTWLNYKLLLPNQPYPLQSGGQIRLGRLQLVVMYQRPSL